MKTQFTSVNARRVIIISTLVLPWNQSYSSNFEQLALNLLSK